MKTGSKFRVGIVGLGSVGMETALSCICTGLSTWGVDLNNNACATLKRVGAYGVSDNAATFAGRLDALLVLVVNATQVRQMLFGETDVAQHLKPDTAVVVSSIIASTDAQGITTALIGFDLEMLDVPVSGGTVKAANGETTVTTSGSDIAFERLAPVLEAVAGKVYHIDAEPRLDSTVKIIHQLLVGVHIAAGAEAVALAARVGISLDVMCDVMTNAVGNSWIFESRMYHAVDGDYTPHSAVNIFIKDLGLVADITKALHFPLPLASTALSMFTGTSNVGYRKEDDSVAIKIFSGVTLPGAKS